MHEFQCLQCGFRADKYVAYTRHLISSGHVGQRPARTEDDAGRSIEDRRNEHADIQYASITATCYCHGEVLRYTPPLIKVSLWTPDNLNDLSLRVEMQMRGSDFHHPHPYGMKVRGELSDAVFAFPFLEIREMTGSDDSDTPWRGVFRSKPDKTGAHFAVRRKEDTA